jgi:NAD(P)-dependent dehydrogenase (short-subunit alcohol dehydrogenase family)
MDIPKAFSLKGRTALVTGSSRGIGAAIAVALAEAGADVVVHFAVRREAAEAVVERIRTKGGTATLIQADLSVADAPASIVREIGSIDILVANASEQHPEPWSEITRDRFDRQVTINFRSTFELIQLVAPSMIERGWGRIVTIGSVQEAKPHPEMVVYAATKSAQTSMMRNFARQLGKHGITVNNVAPGVVMTDRNTERLANPEYAARLHAGIPVGRFAEPEDCVGAVLLFCSEAGSYINGQSLYVDGGMGIA